MPCYSIEGVVPVIDPSAYVHPSAVLIGDVIVGPGCYVGPCASLRGDFGRIVLHRGANVQDTCVIHGFPEQDTVVEENGHIGHGAIVHGARIGRNSLIGMNAVIMDNAVVGAECIVGALTFVPADMQIPDRKVVVGNPAKIVKDVSDEMIAWKTDGTALYQALPKQLYATLKPAEPLREMPADRKQQRMSYRTWNQTKP